MVFVSLSLFVIMCHLVGYGDSTCPMSESMPNEMYEVNTAAILKVKDGLALQTNILRHPTIVSRSCYNSYNEER